MEIARLVISYLQVLVWPCIAIFALVKYRGVIESLVSRSRVKFDIAGVSIETTLETLERSLEENLRGHQLSPEQWVWLKRLQDEGRITFNYERDYKHLSLLRNAGFIREYPEGWLSRADEVEITTLGRLLLEAWERSQKSH